ncbi:MAG TPA: hypothetical protein VMK12_16380 [Anaeromyxobacteraceae bacterium]|nr:hypothetical protein [Anaeromyxobacteraceae bacterium]
MLSSEDTLGVCQIGVTWPGAKPVLRRATSSERDEPASGVGLPVHAALCYRKVVWNTFVKERARPRGRTDPVPTND